MRASSALAPSLVSLGSARRWAVSSASGSELIFFFEIPSVKSSTFKPDQAQSDAKLSTSGSVTDVQQIAASQKCSTRQVNMTISLAFLAPHLVRAAVEGRLPRGIGVERLRDAPAEWSRQFEALGLNPQ
jgi:hypothetical protein